MSIKVQLHGLEKVNAKLKKMERGVQRKIAHKAVSKMAGLIRNEAKRIVHRADAPYWAGRKGKRVLVQPAHVARNIVRVALPENEREAGLSAQFLVKVSNSHDGAEGAANIGIFLEYGTANMPPRPFMRPALDKKAGEARSLAKHVIQRELEALWKK